MKGLVKVSFTDKNTGIGYLPGQNVEFADLRMKDLASKGFVEVRGAETKPDVKAAEPKKEEPEKKVEKPTKKAPAKPTKKK